MVLFLHFYVYNEWYSAFHKVGYELMSYPYVIMFDSDPIKNRNTTVFPQSSSLLAMISDLQKPAGICFHSNFNTRFDNVKCTNNRNMAEIYNVPHTKTKLCRPGTKSPFHPNELPLHMLTELIDLHTGRRIFP